MNCRKSLREKRRNGMESQRAGFRGPKAEYMCRYIRSAKNEIEIINH